MSFRFGIVKSFCPFGASARGVVKPAQIEHGLEWERKKKAGGGAFTPTEIEQEKTEETEAEG
jgi:hypothetical protein